MLDTIQLSCLDHIFFFSVGQGGIKFRDLFSGGGYYEIGLAISSQIHGAHDEEEQF